MKNVNYRRMVSMFAILQAFLEPCAFGSSTTSEIYSIDDFDMRTYKTQYNGLTDDVDGRRDALRKKNSGENHTKFKSFLASASELIKEHNLQDYIGFSLIHRHFEVGDDQVMFEQKNQGTESLVTYAENISDAKTKGAVPATWIFKNEKVTQLFEISNDEGVIEGTKKLKANPTFVSQVKDLMIGSGMNEFLALAVLKRTSLVAQENQILLEQNGIDPATSKGKSIVKVENVHNVHKSTNTTTAWGVRQGTTNVITYLRDIKDNSKVQTTSSFLIPKETYRTHDFMEPVDKLTFENGQFIVTINGVSHPIHHKINFPYSDVTTGKLERFFDQGGEFKLGKMQDGTYSIKPREGLLYNIAIRCCVKVPFMRHQNVKVEITSNSWKVQGIGGKRKIL